MQFLDFRSRIPKLLLAASIGTVVTFGMLACSDEPTSAPSAHVRQTQSVPVNVLISSATSAPGQRVAVAVEIPAAPGTIGGIQGSLSFDPTRLQYVGQATDSGTITIVNQKEAQDGELRFTSFHPGTSGMSGKVAHFVFAVKNAGYTDGLVYHHERAASAGSNLQEVNASVNQHVAVNASLAVPSNARYLSLSDWRTIVNPASSGAPISARPGEYRLNLAYGDVDFDASVGLFDYLAVANAVVGNDQIIIGTDGPAVDVDLVIAGNVFPNLPSSSCGTEADGSRVLDLFDYLTIANEVVGVDDACVGAAIPGRGALPGTVQSITSVSSPDLIIGSGETVTLTNDRVWQLEGTLRVQDGGRLNIQPGTIVQGNTAAVETQAIFVERGGQIFAEGTQNQPITFTCTAAPKFKGCWGGIFIAGRDSVNLGDVSLGLTPDGCNQRPGEGNAPNYGGCNASDNSGVLRYAIIEYAGKVVGANNELNGLTLAGVGRGTTIDHVQIHGGTDDGIEFFGGSVNVKYLVLTGNDDDAFDISFGYRGDVQFVIIQADAGANPADSKAIEADGNEPAPGTNSLPRTSPRLFNFTIVGNLAVTQPAAIHLRRGTGPSMNNFLIIGYPIGLDIDDPLTCDTFGGTPISMLSTTFIDVANLGNDDSGDPTGGACGTSGTEGEEEFINAQASNRTRTGVANVLNDALNTNLPDWRMKLVSGLPAEGGVVTPPTGSIFSTVNYRGAVAPAGTPGDIPWYSGWTRAFQGATTP